MNILSKAKKLNFNTKQFNINYILAIIFVYIGTLAIFSIARILMVLTFIQNDLVRKSDYIVLFKYGFLYDTRVIAIGLILYLVLYLVLKPLLYILNKVNLLKFFLNFYAFVLSFVAILFVVINFYYYEMYKTKIDIFIFNLKDDNTSAIMDIIFSDYPIFKLTSLVFITAFLILLINNYILKKKILFKLRSFVILNITLLLLLIIGARGSLGTFPLREQDHNISNFEVINNLNPNPIIALIWAAGHYKNNYNYASVDKNEFRNLENKLFPLYRQTQEIINYDKPHIVVNLMESFGTNMLLLYAFIR